MQVNDARFAHTKKKKKKKREDTFYYTVQDNRLKALINIFIRLSYM